LAYRVPESVDLWIWIRTRLDREYGDYARSLTRCELTTKIRWWMRGVVTAGMVLMMLRMHEERKLDEKEEDEQDLVMRRRNEGVGALWRHSLIYITWRKDGRSKE
jgi:hypothetical protein